MQPHNPIEHVIIIVKENHTFDHYFGTFPGANGDGTLAHAPDPPPSDPPRDRRGAPAISRSGYSGVLCVRAAVHVVRQLWKTYGDPSFSYFKHIAALKGSKQIAPWTLFGKDIAAGKLPNVSWLYATSAFSEHPPYGSNAGKPVVTVGMQWTADRVNQIAKSKLWASTAIFITWDDWGGWYDHVNPPLKDTWKNGGPAGASYANSQFSYGPRVGCLVLSPYAKQGYISKAFHSHVSIVKFCETTFGLTPLNARDAASDDMSDCFNFKQTPLAPPAWSGNPTPTPTPGPKPKPKPKPRPKRGT